MKQYPLTSRVVGIAIAEGHPPLSAGAIMQAAAAENVYNAAVARIRDTAAVNQVLLEGVQ
jgi:hypothetical protein